MRDFPEHGVKVAWLLLVAVAPERQRAGAGRAIVERVLDECRREGVLELHTGNAAPRYVWPGVDLSNTAALAFFQSLGFEAYDHGLNMLLPTTFRASCPSGVTIERESGDGAAELAAASSRTGRTRSRAASSRAAPSRRATRRTARPSRSRAIR